MKSFEIEMCVMVPYSARIPVMAKSVVEARRQAIQQFVDNPQGYEVGAFAFSEVEVEKVFDFDPTGCPKLMWSLDGGTER
jgi:hypothetical protein